MTEPAADVNEQVTRPPRTRLAPAERHEQLLDVARRLFERNAYDDVTLEGIAEEAGVSPGLVHHYFGTKREVFLAVVAQAIAGFQLAVAAPGPDAVGRAEPDARARLRAALQRYLTFVLERPNGYAFVIGARGAPDPEVSDAIDTAREAVHRAVLAIVGITGEPDQRDDLVMWGWLGFVERATTRWVAQGAHDREQLVEMLLEAARPVLER
jgi:AcrR family transcriptional regulator